MSAKTKFIQRFIGAITLVAFLVIFLPILFNKHQYNVIVPEIEKNTVSIPNSNYVNKNISIDSWVLKVKVFDNKDKAEIFRKELLRKKYAVFVAKDNNGKFVVYIGPELTKEKINNLQNELKEKLKINSDIVNYDPLTM